MRRLGMVLVFTLASGGIALAGHDRPVSNEAQQDTSVTDVKGDEVFATRAAAGGLAEVSLSQLAMDKATSLDVKQFARRMVEDHSKANTELKQIMDKQNLTVPTALDDKHQRVYHKLSKLEGSDFDRQYMKVMLSDHDETVAAFKNESLYGQDPALKSFAMKTLPTLEHHDAMAHDDIKAMKKQ